MTRNVLEEGNGEGKWGGGGGGTDERAGLVAGFEEEVER